MNTWFQQNRFLGTFLVGFALATVAALYFLFSTRSEFNDAKIAFDANVAELTRLQRLAPFPTDANLRKMKSQAEDYSAQLDKLKTDLKTRVLPVVPMAPNEFQTRLRQATTTLAEKARANRVKLPDNFYLGFDEFAAALPDTAAAPMLGQQLAQAELLVNLLLDSRVEAITSFRRVAAAEQRSGATPTPTPPAARRPAGAAANTPQLLERTAIEMAFLSTPGAARRVLNQISSVNEQFYIVRTLHVLNEKDKGPPRDAVAAGVSPATSPGGVAPTGAATSPGAAGTAGSTGPGARVGAGAPASALQFIVGNERIQTSARVEMVRFTF